MKKLLILFAVLLTSVGAWAQTATMPEVSPEPTNGKWADGTKWYTIKTGNNYYFRYDCVEGTGESQTLVLNNQTRTIKANGTWCITGSDEVGYKLFNKAAGASKPLGAVSASNGALVNFVGSNNLFEFHQSDKDGYWCIQGKNNVTNDYFNRMGGVLKVWTSDQAVWGYGYSESNPGGGDDGSALLFEPVEDLSKTIASVAEISNDKVYYLSSSRGALVYSSENPTLLSSTRYYNSIHEDSYEAEWAIYKHTDGNYYFYSLAAKKFIGSNKINKNNCFPLTDWPYYNVQIYDNGTKTGYPFLFSLDGQGAIDNFNHDGFPGVSNWNSGLSNKGADGVSHKIIEIRDLTAEEKQDILNAFNTIPANPVVDTEYVLYDVEHKVFLDIHNLVQAPEQSNCSLCNKLATLNAEKKTLYITARTNQWKIYTNVGEYLKESSCASHKWNSEVSEGEFVWEVNPIKIEDEIYYTLYNVNGTDKGFLGSTIHADGKALFVNQDEGVKQLKLKLHKASHVYKVEDESGVATVLYKGVRYANGDYIFVDDDFAESDFSLIDVIGYTLNLDIENDILRVEYTQNFNPNRLNVLLKNKNHNVYMGIEIKGGTLDNTTVPTIHRLTSTHNKDYRNSWELQLTTYESNGTSTPCFALYNKYYDWYVGKITTRDGAINIEKNIADAGRFDIDYVEEVNDQDELTGNKVLTFKCLNKTTSTDHWYLHQVTSKNYAVVDWDYTANASKWYMIEVTPEDESSWLEQLNDELTAFKNSVNLGTGVGQYSGLTDEQLNDISVPEDVSDLEKAKYCLTTMHDYYSMLVINQPTPGFYRFKAYNTNKYLQNYSKNNNFQLIDQKDISSIMYLSQAKTMLSYGNGQYLNDHTNPVAIGNAPLAWTFVKNDKVLGHYALDMNKHGYLNINDSWVASSDQNNAGSAWIIEPVKELPFTFKKAALGFATFNAPVAVQLPAGVLAYITDMEENVLQMYRLEGNVVPANTPVMLYNEAAKADDVANETTIDLLIVNAYTGDEFDNFDGENDFVGTVAAITYPTTGETVYSLQKKKKVQQTDPDMVGFYKKESGTDLGGFKAWIITATSNARAFTIIFDGDDATGLKEALGLENENVEIYDLSGHRLDKPTKGVNVIGGKLVIK